MQQLQQQSLKSKCLKSVRKKTYFVLKLQSVLTIKLLVEKNAFQGVTPSLKEWQTIMKINQFAKVVILMSGNVVLVVSQRMSLVPYGLNSQSKNLIWNCWSFYWVILISDSNKLCCQRQFLTLKKVNYWLVWTKTES